MKNPVVTYIFLGILGVAALGLAVVATNPPGVVRPDPRPVVSSPPPPPVTMEKYNRIRTGSSYWTVTQIVGPGQELSRSHFPGVPGYTDSLTTIMYQWINPDGSNMNAMFQNDKLVQKAQFGLR
jgi:hypothetical protein